MSNSHRLPHAILERNSRVSKARKIIALVGEHRFTACKRILEIGCGSGVIAHTLSKMAPNAEVFAVDVADNRIEKDGFEFRKVDSTALPFPDGYFDLVISNHVIEHVGEVADQIGHLIEIGRTLSAAGLGYLAVPNKWRLVEPHYKLPILSWLPQKVANAYVRLSNRGTHYDCRPLSASELEGLLSGNGFRFENVTTRALKETFRIEKPDSVATRLLDDLLPDWISTSMMPVIPTIIYLLEAKKQ